VEEGVLPKIQVIVKSRNKTIEIRDNGRGMNAEGLSQFFTMHGQNIDRLRGRPGRGKFGTGKSAAFGIGKLLRVDTCRNGVRNVIQLHRSDIEASAGKDIDLNWIVRNESTDFQNGTTINIEEIFLQKLTTYPIIEYIERHLQIFRASMPEVAVNEHVCQYKEPAIIEAYEFTPSPFQAETIGNVNLTIKVSTSPLPSVEQGIAITAGLGNLVAIETAGIEAKELGNYLFGDIDVPTLESTSSPIEPYDVTRSLQLNPQHPVVSVLLPFIGSKLEEVRKQQVQKLRLAQKSEEARRLASEAQRIADILNNDFKSVIGKLQDIRSASARPGDVASHFGDASQGDTEDGAWIEGIQLPGDVENTASLDQAVPNPEPGPSADPNIV
ncbi:MAG: ATP-binding protein, partial [Candidatus Saccharimonadales bacterium]